MLIKDGAKLVQEIADVLEELPDDVRRALAREVSAEAAGDGGEPGVLEGASGPAKRVLDCCGSIRPCISTTSFESVRGRPRPKRWPR